MQEKGMRQSFSWEDSAFQYVRAYQKAVEIKKAMK